MDEILDFWFGSIAPDGSVAPEKPKMWFTKSVQFDHQIRQQFLKIHEEAMDGKHAVWSGTPRGRMALIILFDQMSRNMFRGTPRAFASDSRALKLAQAGVASGIDKKLSTYERIFFYLPFEHSEELQIQKRSIILYSSLYEEAPKHLKKSVKENLVYAQRHHDIIDIFGRFPHRNKTLGRVSTTEEVAFLKKSGSSF